MNTEQPGRIRGAMQRRKRRRGGGFRLVSVTGARVVRPHKLDAKTRSKAMLPSFLTLLNMMCGFVSVLLAFEGQHSLAAVLIGVAVVLDISDGAVARAVGSITPFGLQFDSLSDLISFGFGPAVLLFTWGLHPLGIWGWILSGLWLGCAAIRLARFNVTIDPLADKRYFTGLPSPGAAGVVLATVFAFRGPFEGLGYAVPICAAVIPAVLMVTSYRFKSFRALISPSKRGIWLSVALVVVLVIGFTFIPAITGCLVAYGYVAVSPLGWLTGPIRRRLFGPDSVAPPRHKLPSVFMPIDDDEDDEEDDEEENEDEDDDLGTTGRHGRHEGGPHENHEGSSR